MKTANEQAQDAEQSPLKEVAAAPEATVEEAPVEVEKAEEEEVAAEIVAPVAEEVVEAAEEQPVEDTFVQAEAFIAPYQGHGSRAAANIGLQTDGSGSYTHPSQLPKD